MNPEVFHIEDKKFTYESSLELCKLLNCRLATYGELKEAYEKGANWCGYGWSHNQHAYYPIQKSYYDSLKEKDLKPCGKPGINGGYFKKRHLKFGVNCFGIRPDLRKLNLDLKIRYIDSLDISGEDQIYNNKLNYNFETFKNKYRIKKRKKKDINLKYYKNNLDFLRHEIDHLRSEVLRHTHDHAWTPNKPPLNDYYPHNLFYSELKDFHPIMSNIRTKQECKDNSVGYALYGEDYYYTNPDLKPPRYHFETKPTNNSKNDHFGYNTCGASLNQYCNSKMPSLYKKK